MPIPGEKPEFSQQFNAFLRASTATQTTFTSAWTAMISQMQTQSNLMASMQQQALENQRTMALMQEQITKLTLQASTPQQSRGTISFKHDRTTEFALVPAIPKDKAALQVMTTNDVMAKSLQAKFPDVLTTQRSDART
ncbi:hypothetical protein GE061_000787 [Apolygus lucorum]|uniref:Uncharacterized protein n=1 Tax=Apolygus lucorum TaxID=248454 RepID=A0A8S9YA96_APOLU|nr:hypothetical protein GE061_000787 [Apolygus lucorum]